MSAAAAESNNKIARAMVRVAGSSGWSQTELKCLANAYEQLTKQGSLSKTQQEVVLGQLYKKQLETLECWSVSQEKLRVFSMPLSISLTLRLRK